MRSFPVHKFLNLSAVDRRLLVTAVLLLGAIRLGLWLLPFQTMMRLLTKMTRHESDARLHKVMAGRRPVRRSSPPKAPARRRKPLEGGIQAEAAPTRDYPDRVVGAVVVASRYVPMSTCLTQALAAQVLLARRGYSAHLHIGVAKEGAEAKLKAHAWVESDGKVLIGGSEPGRYTHLLALEGEEP